MPGGGSEPIRRPSTPTAAPATCARGTGPEGRGGRAAFLSLVRGGPTWWSRASVPVVADRLGIGFDECRPSTPGHLCSTSGFGQDGPRGGWAGHDLNYLAVRLPGLHRAPADGGPPVSGGDHRGRRRRGDAGGPGRHGRTGRPGGGRAGGCTSTCRSPTGSCGSTSLAVDEYLATGAAVGFGRSIITGRYACYDTYRCVDGRWVAVGAIEPKFYANLCRLLDCGRWSGSPARRRRPGRDPGRLRPGPSPPATGTPGWHLRRPRPTPVSAPC